MDIFLSCMLGMNIQWDDEKLVDLATRNVGLNEFCKELLKWEDGRQGERKYKCALAGKVFTGLKEYAKGVVKLLNDLAAQKAATNV